MVLPLWRSLHSLNLMLPKEDRKAMLLRLYNEDTPLRDHHQGKFNKSGSTKPASDSRKAQVADEGGGHMEIKTEAKANGNGNADDDDGLDGQVDGDLETNADAKDQSDDEDGGVLIKAGEDGHDNEMPDLH